MRLATPDDRAAVVDTVVAAFVGDAAFRHFFPDDASYHLEAGAFAGALFDVRVGHGTVWVVDGGASVAMWEPPGVPARALALDVTAGAHARIDRYEEAVHQAMPDEPHWYLGVLATHPAHAGQRWGRAVMAAGLGQAREDGLAACLETTMPANVELYEREGWQLAATVAVEPLSVRVMRHPAGASRASESRPG